MLKTFVPQNTCFWTHLCIRQDLRASLLCLHIHKLLILNSYPCSNTMPKVLFVCKLGVYIVQMSASLLLAMLAQPHKPYKVCSIA